MTQALATQQNTGISPQPDFDPFAAYANAMGGNRIVGKLMKFSKGDYLVGQNGDQIAEGAEFAANLDGLLVGWIRWQDKKPAEQIMGKLSNCFVAAERKTLGDLDKTEWEVDKDGKPQDPWQFTNYLLLKMPGIDDQDALFTFTTSSKGGIGAIAKLCDSYAKQRRMRPSGEQPIVKLGVEKYKHAEYGWLKNPDFRIVGWVAPHEFAAALQEEAAQAEADAAAREAADKDIPF